MCAKLGPGSGAHSTWGWHTRKVLTLCAVALVGFLAWLAVDARHTLKHPTTQTSSSSAHPPEGAAIAPAASAPVRSTRPVRLRAPYLPEEDPHDELVDRQNPAAKRLESSVKQLALASEQGKLEEFAERGMIKIEDGRIQISVLTKPNEVERVKAAIIVLGGAIGMMNGNGIIASMPVASLRQLAHVDPITSIKLVTPFVSH